MSLPRSLSLFFLALGSAVTVGACGSDKSEAGSAQDFIDSYTTLYCDAYKPCCEKKGLNSDGAACKATLTAFAQLAAAQGTYDADAGQKCLDAIKATLDSNKDICSSSSGSSGLSSPGADESCHKVFGSASSSGTKQPGEACEFDEDCAVVGEGKPECYFAFSNGAQTQTCMMRVVGKAGDGPCVATIDGDSSSSSFSSSSGDATPPTRGYTCDKADGLHCDGNTGKCVALGKVGEACSLSDDCAKDTYCGSGKCAPRLAQGEACTGFSSNECAAGSYCDTTAQKCTASLADGAPCTSSSQCLSNSCLNKACAKSTSGDVNDAFLCGGKGGLTGGIACREEA